MKLSHIKSHIKKTVITLACLGLISAPLVVSAAYAPQRVTFDPGNNVSRNTGLGNAAPVDIVAGIINWVLGILAILALILVIYAGFLWMLSQGNEEQVTKAKDILQGALFGLVIILASYGITQWVFENLVNATVNGPA